MKVKEIISEIVNDLRALQIDDRISSRYVLSKLRDKAALYIKRENDLNRLYRQNDIWTPLDCIPMEPADSIDCCDIRIEKCKFYMKSVYKIPKLYTYKGGAIIREVYSMDDSRILIPSTPTEYNSIINREFVDKRILYYWFKGDYLIIPNSQVKLVGMNAFFRDPSQLKGLGCNDINESKCIQPLEEEFQCPTYLLDIVKSDTITNLFNFYKRNIKDENPNDDNNLKQGKPDA